MAVQILDDRRIDGFHMLFTTRIDFFQKYDMSLRYAAHAFCLPAFVVVS